LRLERGEVSSVIRKDLDIELPDVEIQRRLITYGDFAGMNNLLNNENSQTTYFRIQKDPTFWSEYHRQYDEASNKQWISSGRRNNKLSKKEIVKAENCN
jgi:hypothetical protein